MTALKHTRRSRVLVSARCVLIAAVMCFWMTACNSDIITMTPAQFLDSVNTLTVNDYDTITITDTIDAGTSYVQLTDRMTLTFYTDTVTGMMQRAELKLLFDADIAELDYSQFMYFFLVMLKAYDPDITITNINAIHDTLLIETYDAGTNTEIGYGSSTYYYTVTDESALFAAQYILPQETNT